MISGYTVVRNGVQFDYCFPETILSLLGVCDEVVACDSDSTDSTRAVLDDMAMRHNKLRVINRPFVEPGHNDKWVVEWMNFTRGTLSHENQLYLDADEVIGPDTHARIREADKKGECLWFDRINFWRDPQHYAEEGYVCGRFVARFGPTRCFMPADDLYPGCEPEIKVRAVKHPSLQIHHYGFLRRNQAFIDKSRFLQPVLLGTFDPRIESAGELGLKWVDECPPHFKLLEYRGAHPAVIRPWLKERGHAP